MEQRKTACLKNQLTNKNDLRRTTAWEQKGLIQKTLDLSAENTNPQVLKSVKTDFLCVFIWAGRHVQVTISDDFSPAGITIYALEINIDQMNY